MSQPRPGQTTTGCGRAPIVRFSTTGGERSYTTMVADHLGSTRAEVRDASPADFAAIDYWPYGELVSQPPTLEEHHLFTGHEREVIGTASGVDPLEGRDYMHARYYGFNLGRFVSVDPVQGQVGSSQSWNRYTYVRNNPVRFTDPTGREENIGVGAGVIINESSQTVWIAFDADGLGPKGNNRDMRIPLKPGESSSTFTTDADAVIVAPGQTINGKTSGAFKVRLGAAKIIDGKKKGELKMRKNLKQKADLGQKYEKNPPQQWRLRKADVENQDKNRTDAQRTKPQREERIRRKKKASKPWWKFW